MAKERVPPVSLKMYIMIHVVKLDLKGNALIALISKIVVSSIAIVATWA